MTATAAQVLLSTKLYRPPLPADCIRRAELLRFLDEGRTRPLTLVSAPAGFGKSVLVSNWLEDSEWESVWVSLNKEDSDLRRFLSYITAALRERFPSALGTTLSLTQATDLPAAQAIANILSNDLNAIDRPFFLVLDDYHHIGAVSAVSDVLSAILAYPPIPFHLVLITRRDPPLPLDRLRVLGQVTEVRMQDLRFSESETRGLFEHAAGFRVGTDALVNLERELEGWAAALRLLMLAVRGAEDPDAFVRGLRGGTLRMQEYLISKVIGQLPNSIRAWLLQVSVLDRFCASLCETVCRSADAESGAITGETFIEHLRVNNLFLIPLDAQGKWFRLHHLFQRLMRQELDQRFDAASISSLHRRASEWFEWNGLVGESIRCALEAEDTDAAMDIFDRHRREQLERLDWHVVEDWLELLQATPSRRPSVKLAKAFVALKRFDVNRLQHVLEGVESAITLTPEGRDLIGELRCLQGAGAFFSGDGETAGNLLGEARRYYQTHERRGVAGTGAVHELFSLAICGRAGDAVAEFEKIANSAAGGDHVYYGLLMTGLVYVRLLQGKLIHASNDAVRLENASAARDTDFFRGWCHYLQGCADLHQGRYSSAAARFASVSEYRFIMHRRVAFDGMAGHALCLQLQGQDSAAAKAASELRTFAGELSDVTGLEVAASCEARMQLLRGDIDAAARWAGVDSTPPSFRALFLSLEVPALTRARISVALGTEESLTRALRLLEDCRARAVQWHFENQVIEADLLKSLALAGLRRRDDALVQLAVTLARAAPGGWVRPFVEPGTAMGDLLASLERDGQATDYALNMLKENQSWSARSPERQGTVPNDRDAARDILIESLTNRELEILDLLGQRLQNKEIARELSVSPETVKTHLKNLYSKLGVGGRREAADRSRGIISRHGELDCPAAGC